MNNIIFATTNINIIKKKGTIDLLSMGQVLCLVFLELVISYFARISEKFVQSLNCRS